MDWATSLLDGLFILGHLYLLGVGVLGQLKFLALTRLKLYVEIWNQQNGLVSQSRRNN